MSYFTKKIKEREVLIKIAKPYFLIYFWLFFISFVLIIGAAFFSYYLIQKGTMGRIALISSFLVGIFILVRALFVRHFNCLMITDQRIIHVRQKGFFDRLVAEIELVKINDISHRIKGFLGTLLGYGEIQIQSADINNQPVSKIEFGQIKHPARIQELILVLKQQIEEKKIRLPQENNCLLTAEEILSRVSTQEVFRFIKIFRKEIGEKKFEEIMNKVSEDNN